MGIGRHGGQATAGSSTGFQQHPCNLSVLESICLRSSFPPEKEKSLMDNYPLIRDAIVSKKIVTGTYQDHY